VTRRERARALARGPLLAWRIAAGGLYDFVYDLMPFRFVGMSAARRVNLLRAGLNLICPTPTPWNMPLHIQLELGNVCSLRCPVCPTGLGELQREPAFMDPALFERVIDEVGPYLLTASLWGWGEPLLHPALPRILAAARRHPIVTLLSTNGQQLDDPGVLEALLAYPPSHLIVAVDGVTDEANQRYRGGATLAPILEGVARLAEGKRQLRRALPVLHLRYMAMRHNEDGLPRLQAFARDAGFDMITVRTLSIVSSDSSLLRHAELEPPGGRYRPYSHDAAGIVRRPGFVCLQPYWFPSVYADGTVVGCEQDFNAEVPLGRMTDVAGFADVWRSPGAARQRRAIRDNRRREDSYCRLCQAAGRCTTDVSVDAIDITGVLAAPLDIGEVA
jgi:radical SAM protein with 4Fe4S-binding SPASM domain